MAHTRKFRHSPIGYRGERVARIGDKLGITDGRCPRPGTIFDRTKGHVIAFASILARRLRRLVTEEDNA